MSGGEAPIGVISDTHGLLRDEALAALQGCRSIVHAGDIGGPEILDRLGEIAPVTAIRGNVDTAPWCAELPETAVVDVSGHLLYLIHNLNELDLDLVTAGFEGVIFGHTHRPHLEVIDGLFHLNPGSAGPRRFDLPCALALLRVDNGVLSAERIDLDLPKPRS